MIPKEIKYNLHYDDVGEDNGIALSKGRWPSCN